MTGQHNVMGMGNCSGCGYGCGCRCTSTETQLKGRYSFGSMITIFICKMLQCTWCAQWHLEHCNVEWGDVERGEVHHSWGRIGRRILARVGGWVIGTDIGQGTVGDLHRVVGISPVLL